MHRSFLLAALAMTSSSAVLVSGCKKKEERYPEELVTMTELAEAMCACKDRACADGVQERLAKWAVEAANATPRRHSEQVLELMAARSRDYADCMTAVMGAETAQVPDAAPGTAAPDGPPAANIAPANGSPANVPPVPPDTHDVSRTIREATAWARASAPIALARVDISYVDEAGHLDPEYGVLALTFGSDRSDDRKRRTGLPAPPVASTACFTLTLAKGAWAREDGTVECADTIVGPRCDANEIWKRARADHAPTDAVAVIRLAKLSDGPTWYFAITDSARDVNFQRTYLDDCPLQVEK